MVSLGTDYNGINTPIITGDKPVKVPVEETEQESSSEGISWISWGLALAVIGGLGKLAYDYALEVGHDELQELVKKDVKVICSSLPLSGAVHYLTTPAQDLAIQELTCDYLGHNFTDTNMTKEAVKQTLLTPESLERIVGTTNEVTETLMAKFALSIKGNWWSDSEDWKELLKNASPKAVLKLFKLIQPFDWSVDPFAHLSVSIKDSNSTEAVAKYLNAVIELPDFYTDYLKACSPSSVKTLFTAIHTAKFEAATKFTGPFIAYATDAEKLVAGRKSEIALILSDLVTKGESFKLFDQAQFKELLVKYAEFMGNSRGAPPIYAPFMSWIIQTYALDIPIEEAQSYHFPTSDFFTDFVESMELTDTSSRDEKDTSDIHPAEQYQYVFQVAKDFDALSKADKQKVTDMLTFKRTMKALNSKDYSKALTLIQKVPAYRIENKELQILQGASSLIDDLEGITETDKITFEQKVKRYESYASGSLFSKGTFSSLNPFSSNKLLNELIRANKHFNLGFDPEDNEFFKKIFDELVISGKRPPSYGLAASQ